MRTLVDAFIDHIAAPVGTVLFTGSALALAAGAVCGDPAWIAVPALALSGWLLSLRPDGLDQDPDRDPGEE